MSEEKKKISNEELLQTVLEIVDKIQNKTDDCDQIINILNAAASLIFNNQFGVKRLPIDAA